LGFDLNNIKTSIYECVIDEISPLDVVLKTDVEGLDLIPSHIDLVGAEIEMLSMPNREKMLKQALEKVKDDYDFILIDCSPSLGLLVVNALTASDSVIIPVQTEYFALEGLGKLLNTIKIIQSRLNKELDIEGFLLTMYDTRLNLSNQVVEEVRKHFDSMVFDTLIQRNVKLSEAPSYGKPVIMYDAASKGAENYLNLAREVLQRNNMTSVDEADRIIE
jgi:chromosome partitioning protein